MEENGDGVGEEGWGGIGVCCVVQRALIWNDRRGRDGEQEGSTNSEYGP